MANSRITTRQLSRRHFAVTALTALFVTIAITACDDGGPVSVGPGGTTGRTGSISANHGHEASITSAQLSAGDAVTLDIRGSADHSHTVTLSGTEVDEIRNGRRVTTISSADASPLFGTHTHTVTFN